VAVGVRGAHQGGRQPRRVPDRTGTARVRGVAEEAPAVSGAATIRRWADRRRGARCPGTASWPGIVDLPEYHAGRSERGHRWTCRHRDQLSELKAGGVVARRAVRRARRAGDWAAGWAQTGVLLFLSSAGIAGAVVVDGRMLRGRRLRRGDRSPGWRRGLPACLWPGRLPGDGVGRRRGPDVRPVGQFGRAVEAPSRGPGAKRDPNAQRAFDACARLGQALTSFVRCSVRADRDRRRTLGGYGPVPSAVPTR
jgi:hypothetical protein